MDSWEARMSRRAAERRGRETQLVEMDRRQDDPHGSHHQHFRDGEVLCSCGLSMGLTCFVLPADYDPENPPEYNCELCGMAGVSLI